MAMTKPLFDIDPVLVAFEDRVYDTPLIRDVWKKYLWKDEKTPQDVYVRVANAIADVPCEGAQSEAAELFYEAMSKRVFLPGGRILAGAGTEKRVTLMNCYVNGTIEDSMEGIVEAYGNLMFTSQQGGGMGTAFETIRPLGAVLKRTHSAASGPLPFMDTFNAGGKCVRSAGERRAAQMGTISDTHPDMPAFIVAKGEGLKDGSKRFAEFNLSVLVSDAFKGAVEDDEEWLLYFHIPPVKRSKELEQHDFVDDTGVQQYVYSVWRARDLWDLITRYTFEFSDPGVIFIDRINDLNNLSYIETIRCTNPCGEQPLPPHGTCNLGAINVAQCVRKPFSDDAELDLELISRAAQIGVRFLDNVIEATNYPLEAQRLEEYNKRRIGLGLTGLGTLFAELKQRYGSVASERTATQVMKTICLAAYTASMDLAKARGRFPLYDDIIVDCGFIKYRLPEEYREEIKKTGLRNGVILTIAPVGTGSIAIGNVSSGLEPDFAHQYERRVRKNNTEEFDVYTEESYTYRLYKYVTKKTEIPDYMVTAQDLSIPDHIKIQGAVQTWVDASVSKTVNIPEHYTYEDFVEVYELAYKYGCKGCTTYRPSQYRDSILSVGAKEAPAPIEIKRGDVLEGKTYKIKWPSLGSSIFITINYLDTKPYEIFFASKDAKFQDWMSGLTLMASALLRSGVDPAVIPRELKQVVSTHDTQWHKGKFYGSLVARIGAVVEQDFIDHGLFQPEESIKNQSVMTSNPVVGGVELVKSQFRAEMCPSCKQPALVKKEGCDSCMSCGYSHCG